MSAAPQVADTPLAPPQYRRLGLASASDVKPRPVPIADFQDNETIETGAVDTVIRTQKQARGLRAISCRRVPLTYDVIASSTAR